MYGFFMDQSMNKKLHLSRLIHLMKIKGIPRTVKKFKFQSFPQEVKKLSIKLPDLLSKTGHVLRHLLLKSIPPSTMIRKISAVA